MLEASNHGYRLHCRSELKGTSFPFPVQTNLLAFPLHVWSVQVHWLDSQPYRWRCSRKFPRWQLRPLEAHARYLHRWSSMLLLGTVLTSASVSMLLRGRQPLGGVPGRSASTF